MAASVGVAVAGSHCCSIADGAAAIGTAAAQAHECCVHHQLAVAVAANTDCGRPAVRSAVAGTAGAVVEAVAAAAAGQAVDSRCGRCRCAGTPDDAVAAIAAGAERLAGRTDRACTRRSSRRHRRRLPAVDAAAGVVGGRPDRRAYC